MSVFIIFIADTEDNTSKTVLHGINEIRLEPNQINISW